MNRLQLNQSLKDVLPTHSGDYPPQLVAYTDSLYQLSLQKIPSLPHKADVARYHLCAFLAVEKYKERLSLPAPLLQKIPLQPRLVEKVLTDLEQKVVIGCASPVCTPTKPTLLPSKRSYVPGTSSPLKKLQKLASDGSPSGPPKETPFTAKLKALRDEDSPFNVKNGTSASLKPNIKSEVASSPLRTPKNSPRKSGVGRSPLKSPSKSPSKTPLSSPSKPRYVRDITVADFISFANNFYIPASVTPRILDTFLREQHKFLKKNDWLLACGLIHAAYVRINHRLLQSTLGRKTQFQDQLFQYQKGGLMKANMINWLNITEESVKNEPWAIDLELKYVHNDWSKNDTTQEREIQAKIGPGWEIYLMFGSMINPSVMLDTPSQVEYYNVWTSRVYEKLKSVLKQKEL